MIKPMATLIAPLDKATFRFSSASFNCFNFADLTTAASITGTICGTSRGLTLPNSSA